MSITLRTWDIWNGEMQYVISPTADKSKRKKCSVQVTPLSVPTSPPPCEPEPEQVTLKIFKHASQVWKPKYQGRVLKVKQKIFPVTTTVNELLEKMPVRLGQGWALTEVVELGDGKWSKGTTVAYGSEKGDSTFAELGWTPKRGIARGMPPVWIAIHKIAE